MYATVIEDVMSYISTELYIYTLISHTLLWNLEPLWLVKNEGFKSPKTLGVMQSWKTLLSYPKFLGSRDSRPFKGRLNNTSPSLKLFYMHLSTVIAVEKKILDLF